MPAVGEHELRILTPSLLELTLVTTKKENERPVGWDFVGDNFKPQLPAASDFRVSVDGEELAISKVGFKRRPLYGPLKARDLRIQNQLYLELDRAIPAKAQVRVENLNGKLWVAEVKFEASADPLRYSPAIHVNQAGYQTGFPKSAMAGYYLGSLGEMPVAGLQKTRAFVLIDAAGKEVFSGTLGLRPDRGFNDTPYQQVLEADFTKFDQPGVYRMAIEGLGASMPFQIHDGTLAMFARAYALGLYHQRCGTSNALPFTRHVHDACHIAPAQVPDASFKRAQEIIGQVASEGRNDPKNKAPLMKNSDASLFPFVRDGAVDVSGGHHDAGDYSKYTINSAHLVHTLVFAADHFAGAGALDNLGLPESGDGLSDLLQEAKWEADFLAKMQDSDGGFYFLVYPRERRYEDNVLPDKGDPQIVWPKITSASAAATAALAQTASSPLFRKQFPEAADLYLRRALRGWAFLERAIEKHGRAGSYQPLTHYGHEFGHEDELGWAAASLFRATGEKKFERWLINSFKPEDPDTRRWTWWPLFESWGNAVRTYVFAARAGQTPGADANFRARCEKLILETAANHVRFAEMSAYGTSFPDANKANRNAGWFFSSERAFDITVAYQIDPSAEFKRAVISNLNYEAGCNPINVSYITGLGWRRPREMVHQFAQNDARVLPPSGLPMGNIQAGFAYLHHYKKELGELPFPPDGAASGGYPFYDRWGDSFNTTTEFVVVDQARSLASLAFWMAQTPAKEQRWRAAPAKIEGLPSALPVGKPADAKLKVEGLDIGEAQVLWEARDSDPVFGETARIRPKNVGEQWVEAEAVWRDGRRVFASAKYEATADTDIAPHPLRAENLQPSPGAAALYHLDGGLRDDAAMQPALALTGRASLDTGNLGWMRERKGSSLRFHDLGDRATAEIKLPMQADKKLVLQAMIYLNGFKAYNRTNATILALTEDWNSSIGLIENLYEGPMIKGGTKFSVGKQEVSAALIPGAWHLVQLSVSPGGYEARIDGKTIGQSAEGELSNWGRKPARLEVGDFDGYIDEISIRWE